MQNPLLNRFPAGSSAADVLAGQAEIVDAVLAANRVFVAVASEALAGSTPEVTIPQFRALVLLEARRSMTVAELAEDLGVVPSTATRMCDRLVTKRLVTRATGRANRRQVTLSLRPEGRALIAESTRRRKERIEKLLASIPQEDQRELVKALRLLVQAAAR